MQSLTVASLNTFGVSLNFFNLILRYKAISNHFLNSSVDTINFQEVFTYFHLFILRGLLKKYPYCQYSPSYLGPRGGLIIFSRFPLVNTQYRSFNKRFIPRGLSLLEVIFQKGMLITESQDLGIIFVNTHFTAVLNQDWSQSSCYYSELASEVIEFQQVLKDKIPEKVMIASGDFNIARESDLYKQLVDFESLYNPFENDNTPTRQQSFMSTRKTPNCVDYMFIFGKKRLLIIKEKKHIFTSKVALSSCKIGYVSDHIGLQISFRINI